MRLNRGRLSRTEIRFARAMGYCPGVENALRKVREALASGPHPIFTLGPLIHNEQVTGELEKEGVRAIEDLSPVEGGTVILRSHGTPVEEVLEAEKRASVVVDATCPFVAKAQEAALAFAKEGRQVFVVGDENHPEVKAILARAGRHARAVTSVADLAGIEVSPRVGVLAQTTVRERDFLEVVSALKERAGDVVEASTICPATRQRQEATLELAAQSDLVLVVGAKTSANCRQLLKIARETGTDAYLVGTAGEIRSSWLRGRKVVGITSGASTPDRIVKEVAGKLEEMEKELRREEREQEETPTPPSRELEEAAETRESAQETPELPREIPGGEEMLHQFPEIRQGDIIKGTVVSVDENGALVDVGLKSEGFIPAGEISRRGVPEQEVKAGDEISVYVLSVDSGEGGLRLSKRRADEELAWQRLENARVEGKTIEAPVIQEVKGGLVVDVGVRGFVPASQVERGYVSDLKKYVGKTLRMKVLELDRRKNRVILSQRVVLEEEHERLKQETWATIAEGQVRHGVVKGVTDFGVFVDLGGVDGLLHISELAWGRVRHPSEVVKEGDEIDVMVLRVDKEKGKISLGRKQVLPDPWDQAESKYPAGSVVTGTVTRIAPFGAFVELEPGVEGLVHISELSFERVTRPEDVVKVGDTVRARVLRVRPAERRIALSIKEADVEIDEEARKVAAPRTDETERTEPAGEPGAETGEGKNPAYEA